MAATQGADKYRHKLVDRPSDLLQNPLYMSSPLFLEYSVIYVPNQFVQPKLKLFYFVRVIRNSTVVGQHIECVSSPTAKSIQIFHLPSLKK